ncbi:protein FAM221A-like [Micropterus dolomieu]|uniref:protein FAM221A-like n=1 Tax=Micropterus dolomieu TaxID=147949 RepID=UPI001E8E2965|nr:protein FAM221A-like [Micropterus dolomieu]
MFPGLGQTLSTAGVNTCLRITVKPLATCAKSSPFTCLCGQASSAHQTLVETKLEREARGQPIGRDVPYAAMGGLIGFSSLLDGYLALEPSGSEQDREDGCQQRCSASWIKEMSPKNPSVFTVRERPTNSEMQCPSQSSSVKPNH